MKPDDNPRVTERGRYGHSATNDVASLFDDPNDRPICYATGSDYPSMMPIIY